MQSLTSLVLCLLILNVARPCGAEAPATLPDEQEAWVQKATRSENQGWIFLHIEGTPRERGFQHGYLLPREFAEALRVRQEIWHYESAMDWPWLIQRVKTFMSPKVDKENREEMEGLVEGLKAAGVATTLDEVVAYNGFLELLWYWWDGEKKKLGSDTGAKAPPEACSSFIATGSMTSDGQIVLGHNTMFDYPTADYNVVLDIVPARGHRILMQTGPGLIHSGTDFFITDAGLVGSETTIGDFDGFEEKGIPEFVRVRRAMQDAASIDEWCAIMKQGNNGGYANAWLLGDVNTGEIARLELGLKHTALERTKDGYFIGSNVAEDLKILRFETSRKETDIRLSSVARRVRWKNLMKEFAGKVTLERAKYFEADHFDSYLNKDNPGGRSLCGHFELDPQSSGKGTPFEPSGTFDGKVVNTQMAKEMSFLARWGSACGRSFDAERFLAQHPQFDWMQSILKSRDSYRWTQFKAKRVKE